MNRFLLGVITTAAVITLILVFVNRNEEKEELQFNSALIQQQIQQVGKLVVTEGNFSQVTSYKNTKKNYLDLFSAKKKALVIVNAKVTVSYDLRQIKTSIDGETKTLTIISIPEEEVNIYPDIEYYDVSQDYFNQFGAEDYNKIKNTVTKMINEKIEASDLKENAKARLISELQKIYILTNSMGWTLKYNDQTVDSMDGLERFNF
jgi:trans-2-enoyl-CoA reductase